MHYAPYGDRCYDSGAVQFTVEGQPLITVEDIMTSRLYTLKASNAIQDASELMKQKSIRHVPVVNDFGRLLGLVTQKDILMATSPVGTGSPEELSASLTYVMNRRVITIPRDTSLAAAARLMREHKIGCLPVVGDERLVGIITDSDYVDIAIHLLEQMDLLEPEEEDEFV